MGKFIKWFKKMIKELYSEKSIKARQDNITHVFTVIKKWFKK
jgi:hypothetical protein